MAKIISDVVVDLAYGDCAKGKITHHLLKDGTYDRCVRFSGGANAGHSIIHNGKSFVTHLIPAGVFFNIRSIIGPGCVLNVKSFFEEIEYLERGGVDVSGIKVAENVHIVTDEHLAEDSKDAVIGTTKRGIGPCVRDKYARVGTMARDIPELQSFLVDFYDEVFTEKDNKLLLEGAQGFYLDPHFGSYPHVTSTHCTVAAALLNGIPHSSVRNVFGAIKAYETYVGLKQFEGTDPVFAQMREIGKEYGATTGRARQCNYLNIDGLKRAINVNNVNVLVINKMDVLQQVGCWKVRFNDGSVLDLKDENGFKDYLHEVVGGLGNTISIAFSYSPEAI